MARLSAIRFNPVLRIFHRRLRQAGKAGKVALGAAIARPYSSLAAGTLTPLYGLALCGLWAARYGTFPPRPPARPEKGRKKP